MKQLPIFGLFAESHFQKVVLLVLNNTSQVTVKKARGDLPERGRELQSFSPLCVRGPFLLLHQQSFQQTQSCSQICCYTQFHRVKR